MSCRRLDHIYEALFYSVEVGPALLIILLLLLQLLVASNLTSTLHCLDSHLPRNLQLTASENLSKSQCCVLFSFPNRFNLRVFWTETERQLVPHRMSLSRLSRVNNEGDLLSLQSTKTDWTGLHSAAVDDDDRGQCEWIMLNNNRLAVNRIERNRFHYQFPFRTT